MIPYKVAYRVNKEINESVKYRRDIDLYQKPEHWTPAILEGNCEDYALAKRKKLLELGDTLYVYKIKGEFIPGEQRCITAQNTQLRHTDFLDIQGAGLAT